MELKESAYIFLGAFALLLALGYVTNGTIYYFSSAILLVLLISDYILLRYRLAAARGHITLTDGLSHRERAPGRPATFVADIVYTGRRPLKLYPTLLKDGGIIVGPMPDVVTLTPGQPVTLEVTLTPSTCGEPGIGPLIGSVDTLLLKASFPLSVRRALAVKLPIGARNMRHDSADRQDRSLAIGDLATDMIGGADFFGIRKYMPGDPVWNIDWSRTAKYRDLVVKEFEQERPLPAFVLVDASIAGPAGEPAVSPGLAGISLIIDRILSNNEPMGMICFSSNDIQTYVRPGVGRSHVQLLKKAISDMKPTDSENRAGRDMLSIKDLYKIGKAYDGAVGHPVLEPIFQETLEAYSANIRDDGFARAMRKAIEAADGWYSIIVATGLSMGMASLLNGIRLASYYGHSVTVLLVPASEDEYVHLDAAASKLRGRPVKVLVLRPGENVENMIFEGRIKSRPPAIRV